MNPATLLVVLKLERRKLTTVVTNIAAVARLENPFRLSCFAASWDIRDFAEEKTNAKMMTDAEKSTTNNPDIKLADEPHTASDEDAHRRIRKWTIVRDFASSPHQDAGEACFRGASWINGKLQQSQAGIDGNDQDNNLSLTI